MTARDSGDIIYAKHRRDKSWKNQIKVGRSTEYMFKSFIKAVRTLSFSSLSCNVTVLAFMVTCDFACDVLA